MSSMVPIFSGIVNVIVFSINVVFSVVVFSANVAVFSVNVMFLVNIVFSVLYVNVEFCVTFMFFGNVVGFFFK